MTPTKPSPSAASCNDEIAALLAAVRDGDIVALLAAVLAPRVAAALAKLQANADDYTSLAPAPRTTPRVHNEACRSGRVAGATKVGRVWRCTRSAWLAARSTPARVPAPLAALVAIAPTLSEQELASIDLETSRLRATTRRSA